MATSGISQKTLWEFQEYLSRHSKLRVIRHYFHQADIHPDPEFNPEVSGERRILVQQHYHTLDLANPLDQNKLLRAFEVVLVELEHEAQKDGKHGLIAAERRRNLAKWLKRDGFVYRDGHLMSFEGPSSLEDLELASRIHDAAHLRLQIRRIYRSVEDDPWLAIGTAKELVETTCKTILTESDIAFSRSDDLMDLVKKTRAQLRLAPSDIPDEAKASETIKRLLSNLATLVQGLAELRNPYGTGHGPSGDARGLRARHARLAAGASAALATFLFDTHRDRESESKKAVKSSR